MTILISQHNMTSWNVQVIPTPPLIIRVAYLGTKAADPAVTVYSKTSARSKWRRVLTISSASRLVHNGPAMTMKWPAHTPQFFGYIKVDVSWSVGGRRDAGKAVFVVKRLKTKA